MRLVRSSPAKREGVAALVLIGCAINTRQCALPVSAGRVWSGEAVMRRSGAAWRQGRRGVNLPV